MTSMVGAQNDASSAIEQDEVQRDESELRLAQLQHQLPSNEPGSLMSLVADESGEAEEDDDTRECKKFFKNMKFFLSREVRQLLIMISFFFQL